ncbi:MAG: hypothetical protein Q8L48_10640 [Archangium sp.]|nr:hypothetical protein [Archangium sp.]
MFRITMVAVVLVLAGCDPTVVIGDPDGGGDAGQSNTDAGAEATCTTDPTEPNDSAARAHRLTFGVPVTPCLSEGDDDLFSVTAGNTAAGGYFVATLTTPSQLERGLYASVREPDQGEIARGDGNNPVRLFWASRPGVTWNLHVSRFSGDAGVSAASYTASVTWTPITDAWEPNDSRQDARPISVGAPIQALLVGGRLDSNLAQLEYRSADWYRVRLTAGQRVRLALTNVPLSVTPTVSFFCAACSSATDEKGQTSPGQDISLLSTSAISTTGDYDVRVWNLGAASDAAMLVSDLPPHFTQPYTLTVTQEP